MGIKVLSSSSRGGWVGRWREGMRTEGGKKKGQRMDEDGGKRSVKMLVTEYEKTESDESVA